MMCLSDSVTKKIGLDPQIMILHEVISEILEISDFEAAIWKNGRN